MKKTILFIFAFYLFNLSFAKKIPIPELKSPVTDLTNTLYDFQIQSLENKLHSFGESHTSQIAVLLIPTTSEESIEEYSMRVAELWKIGSVKNDDGVIIIVAKKDRKLRIEVGYGLENIITDAEAGYIINEIITPSFKNGDFYIGIYNAIERLTGLINGISPSLDEIISDKSKNESGSNDTLIILIIIIIVLFIFKKLTGKSILGTVILGSNRSTSHKSWGSSSTGRSSFGGGGGSFGGGGSSGSW